MGRRLKVDTPAENFLTTLFLLFRQPEAPRVTASNTPYHEQRCRVTSVQSAATRVIEIVQRMFDFGA